MPAPRMGRKPLGNSIDPNLFRDDDPLGWTITQGEEEHELRPGMRHIAKQLLAKLEKLGRGEFHGIAKKKLAGNPCWSMTLRAPAHERYVLLLPLALSRTQDDKGRIRWTLFGASEHGPSRPFFRTQEPLDEFFERLLLRVYGERSISGFRVHNRSDRSLSGVRYLLTFTPFQELPQNVRDAYLHGDLHLLPFPGSLLFFHAPAYRRLQAELPAAMQIPLLQVIERNEAPRGIRVPQSGWMHEGGVLHTHHGPIRNTMHRTNRWARVHRHEDELAVFKSEEKVANILFSSDAYDIGLYDKPMARNSQICTHDYRLLLDCPRAGRPALTTAA